MKKCVILDDYQGVALKYGDWNALAGRVAVTSFREHIPDEDALAERLADADIVVIMRERTPFPASLFKKLPRLGLLVTSGMRNAAIDLTAAGDVVVCGTGSSSAPPAELTWGLILGLARQIPFESAQLHRNGPWQSTVGVDLHGRRLGIIGLGKIGIRVAQVGQAFGMHVTAWSPNLTDERAAAAGVERMASREELLESSDFVTIHLVLAPTTRGIIGAGELRRMRPSAFLINTSRAALVDQAALVQALEGELDRRRALGCLRRRATSGGSPVPAAAQCPGDTPSRLRLRRELPNLFHGGGGRHRGMAVRVAHPAAQSALTRRIGDTRLCHHSVIKFLC